MLASIKHKLINQPIAIDLETYDPLLTTHYPAWVHPSLEGHIAGICLATADEEWYIPIGHAVGENHTSSPSLAQLDEILNSGSHLVVFFNAHYDYGWLKGRHGITISRPIYDGMIGAPLLDEHKRSYSLENICYEELGIRKSEEVMKQAVIDQFGVSGKDYKGHIWKLDPKFVEEYGKQDARMTYDLWVKQVESIKKQELDRVLQLELDLIEPLIDIRLRGVRIDVPKVKKLKDKYQAKCRKHLNKLSEMAGCRVVLNGAEQDEFKKLHPNQKCLSVGSARQMGALCDELGMSYNRTSSGLPSFAEDNLTDECSELATHIIKAKRYGNKVVGTYLEGYIEHFLIEDRIHAQFNQLRSVDGGTITGRFSCCNPNLQNIPARDPEIGKDLMSLFIADEGKVFIGMDYSSQEPRMAVHIAITIGLHHGFDVFPELKMANSDKFQNRDADFHMEVSRAVVTNMWKTNNVEHYYENLSWFRPIPDDWTGTFFDWLVKCYRTPAKEIGLGTMYSMGPKTLKEKLEAKGIYLNVEQVKSLQTEVYDAVPFLRTINEYCTRNFGQRGYIRTVLGRRNRANGYEVPEFFYDATEDKWTVVRHLRRDRQEAILFASGAKGEGREIGGVQYQDEYKALNKYIQGSAADQSKLAVLETWRAGIIPQIFVHDAQIQSIDESQVPRCVSIMENALPLNVQSKVDYKIGRTWADVK